MNNPNHIEFDVRTFERESDMWRSISALLKVLTDNDYIALVKYEDAGIYCVEYSNADRELGDIYPVWLTPEQEESIDFGS